MKHAICALGLVVLCMTWTPPTPARASRARVRTLRDISGPSPFDGCGGPTGFCFQSDNLCNNNSDCAGCATCVPGDSCIDLRGEQYEPHVAVNPVNRRNLIAVYMQDNYRGNVVFTSRDRGRHWTQVPVPRLTECSGGGGTTDFAFDPRVAIGPDGIAYTSTSVVDEPAGPGNGMTQSVLVNRSTDGGLSWSDPVTVDTQVFNDFPVLTADPTRLGTAYLALPPNQGGGPLRFSRTTDGGATWTSPAIIPIFADPVAMTGPIAGQFRVLPDGTLVLIFLQLGLTPTTTPTEVWVALSADQGDHWSGPTQVATVAPNFVTDPDCDGNVRPCAGAGARLCGGGTNDGTSCTSDGDCSGGGTCGARIRRGGGSFVVPSAAVGADGTLYLVWHRIESTSSSQIQFVKVKSVEGGVHFTAPAPVAVETTQAFLPTVAVSPAGTVGVTYFDFRNDVLGDAELTTDLWFRHSHDGGATWSETHLAGPFDLRPAPLLGVYPLGDYFGLAPMGRTGFGAVWIQTIGPQDQDQDNTDAFFARLRVSPRR